MVHMCMNVIKVSIYLNNWTHVVSYVNKALATPDFVEGKQRFDLSQLTTRIARIMELCLGHMKGADNLTIVTRLNCASGLAELANRKYKSAARHFLNATLDHCDIPDMLSPPVIRML